jgi:hypothetical protein
MLGPDSEVKLKKIDPSRLVGETQDDLEDFFLTLAVIYNDLKGIAHLQKDFFDNHPAPENSIGASAWLGEFNGMVTQFYKMQAGFINEFLDFIEAHDNIFFLPKFKILFSRLSQERKLEWQEIRDAALGKDTKGNLGNKLMLIRHNVAYHYYKSEKVLRGAFLDFFGDRTKPGADYAYYAVGETLESSRFFYADAAVQRFLMKTAIESNKTSFEEMMAALNRLQNETFELLGMMNTTIAALLSHYIRMRHEERSK